MPNDIVIKTKYTSKQECINNCLDHQGKTYLTWVFNYSITGIIDDKGHFEISCMSRAAAMQEFIGDIVEKEDGVYMIGKIIPKPFTMRSLIVLTTILVIIAPIYVLKLGFVGLMVMVITCSILGINYYMMLKTDSLFNRISKKVT